MKYATPAISAASTTNATHRLGRRGSSVGGGALPRFSESPPRSGRSGSSSERPDGSSMSSSSGIPTSPVPERRARGRGFHDQEYHGITDTDCNKRCTGNRMPRQDRQSSDQQGQRQAPVGQPDPGLRTGPLLA